MNFDSSFFKSKKVLVTGHTGFKGSWLCRVLYNLGADIYGYALEPSKDELSLFDIANIKSTCNSCFGDIRDYDTLLKFFSEVQPEIVIHMAAQPIVRTSYTEPKYTYETNVNGTVNILECVRKTSCVKSFLNVTTDKVYENQEKENYAFREGDSLDGYDPYSNSKSCSELVTHSYKKCFFDSAGVPISTARAGNVIGGGDFAKDRIIPDCVRASIKKETIRVRNPYSIRPYQHVLEPLFVYLLILEKQYEDISLAGWYNVGPDDSDCYKTGDLVSLFVKYWGNDLTWKAENLNAQPHEASFLRLNCDKLKSVFGWSPRWNIEKAIEKTVEWTKCWSNRDDICSCMDKQIGEFLCGM